jgi:undecaprenyl-diphosphatase
MLAGTTLATELLNLALKETFRRSRPSLFEEIATLHSYSFPSGHAMASAAAYGAVAVLVARDCPSRAPVAFAAAAVLALLIGASRIYLGVHWMTDVLAGWAAGLFVLLIGAYLLARSDARASPS